MNRGARCVSVGLLVCIILFSFDICDTLQPENEPDVQTKRAIEEVDGSNLGNAIAHLQSYGNRSTWEKQWEAAIWLSREFEKTGIEAGIHKYEFNGKIWPNVIAKIEGKERPEEIIMAIAHMDSTSDHPQNTAPGADDNASGAAVILEMARVVRDIPMARTVMFSIFSNEERGRLGSQAFARQAGESGMRIKTVINLDILGYNRPERFFYWAAVDGHAALNNKIKAIIKMARNYFVGVMSGKDIVQVAGRESDRETVSIASRLISRSTGLKVKEIVSDDCG